MNEKTNKTNNNKMCGRLFRQTAMCHQQQQNESGGQESQLSVRYILQGWTVYYTFIYFFTRPETSTGEFQH
jgi:hypothetical protein